MTFILGIESSCDETAAAVVEDGVILRSNIIASQHDLHRRYGGVVPEIASRAHLERIDPVIQEALSAAGITASQIDAVAVGNRPGLIGSLLVGVSAAKAIAWSLDRPLIGIDHVQAHLYAASIRKPGEEAPLPVYPALGLVVSGGHSSMFLVSSPTRSTLLGKTIDDAVGEAYDKAAIILGLPFPGGPNLDKLAKTGNPQAHDLPRPLLDGQSLDFSFSGMKTAMLYKVRGLPQGRGANATFTRSASDLSPQEIADLAASFQHAAVDTIIRKLARAVEMLTARNERPGSLIVGGGVSANSHLRARCLELGQQLGIPVHLPAMSLCVDNAAMIAGLAHCYYQERIFSPLDLPAIATV